MRVLVVDDSAFMRRAVSSMLITDPDIQVVGVAKNGVEAVEFAKRLRPDAITLDIEMPEMDGLTALRHIMRECPTAVLMLSSLTAEGSNASLKALSLGAGDVLAKDHSQVSMTIGNLREELIEKIKALAASPRVRSSAATSAGGPPLPTFRPGQFDVICIGSSTGGPPVLESILASLPQTLTTPIVVAQHMPLLFTRSMAQRLDDICPLTVVHAEDGQNLVGRTVYIAPGEHHLQIVKVAGTKHRLTVGEEPRSHPYRPSVTALFSSAAKAMGPRTLGIVLTGIGNDGLVGAQELHALGAPILAQSQETCVVYGMPKAVTQAGVVTACLAPSEISRVLATLASPVGAAA